MRSRSGCGRMGCFLAACLTSTARSCVSMNEDPMPVDHSIEVGHFSLPRMTPPVLEAAAFQAAYWLVPWLRTFTGTDRISVLLDDYTASAQGQGSSPDGF